MARQYPSVKQLRYLIALDKYQHFGHAAESCFVTQSAFSLAIKELESLLGAQLVDRNNKQVIINILGQQVVSQARLCLQDLDLLVDIVERQVTPLSGVLRLGVIPTIAPFLLPKLLPKVQKAYPKLQLQIREAQTDAVVDSLLNGELDLVLMAFPYPVAKVQTVTLFKDHFRLVAHKQSSRVDQEKGALNRLQHKNVLLLEDGHCMRDHTIGSCRLGDATLISDFSANSLHTLVQMVNNDLGVTYLPQMAISAGLLKSTNIASYPLSATAYREVGLAWRKSSAKSEDYKLLGNLIKQVVDK